MRNYSNLMMFICGIATYVLFLLLFYTFASVVCIEIINSTGIVDSTGIGNSLLIILNSNWISSLIICISILTIVVWTFLIFKFDLSNKLSVQLSNIENIVCCVISMIICLLSVTTILIIQTKYWDILTNTVSIFSNISNSVILSILSIILGVFAMAFVYIFVKWIYAKFAGIDDKDSFIKKLSETKCGKYIRQIYSGLSLFDMGIYIILFIFFTILTSTVLLILNVSITLISIIIALILSTLSIYIIVHKNPKKILCLFLSLLFILSICIGISGNIYDDTWDGEAYHKVAVGLLENGWNPIYETSSESINRLGISSIIPSGNIIADAYAKGSWIFSASCYSLFGNIETGKCCTLLGIIALFCIAYSFLVEKVKLKKWQSGLCAFFLAANTVTLSQVLTYYNDGFMWTQILIYISCLIYLSYGDYHKYKLGSYALIFATACIGMNVKFSGLLFFGIFGAIFYFYWIYQRIKVNGCKKSIRWIRNISLFFIVLVLLSCCLFGSTTYIPNIINHDNPVYGLIGNTNIASIDENMPLVLKNIEPELRFISSIIYPTTNSATELDYKIPFTITSISEIYESAGNDCRIAGWGVMFSGLFIIGLICMLITMILSWKKDKNLFSITLLLLLGILIPSIFIEGMWWARYNMLPVIIQIFGLVFLFSVVNSPNKCETDDKSNKNILHMIAIFAILLIIVISTINILPATVTLPYQQVNSLSASEQINQLAIIPDGNILEVDTSFMGRLFNLVDRNIFYNLNQSLENPDGSILGYYGFTYKIIPT